MARYFLTNKAVNDLTLIWDYTFEQWSEKQADKYYDEIINSCKTIAENKYLGKKYSEIFPNLLSSRINRRFCGTECPAGTAG
mgnify:CR=1 FL=1